MMRPPLWTMVILLCTAGHVAAGTVSASTLPTPGTRIRVTARMPERQRWTGTFVSVANDTVTMHAGDRSGGVLAVPTLSVTRFEISRGTRSTVWRGAGVGLVLGAAAGAAVGYLATRDESDGAGPGAYSLFGAVVVGAVGAAIGAGNGARATSEQWRTVPLDELRSATTP